MKNIKCLFGMHEWIKFGGIRNLGNGKFKVTLICKKCRKMNERIK